MSEESALREAIRLNPLDSTPRGVLADWLDEHDRHREAALMRVLAWPDDDAMRLQYADVCEAEGDEERAEFVREQIRQNELKQLVAKKIIRIGTNGHGVPNRGFVSFAIMDAADWISFADAILEEHPIEMVRLTTWPIHSTQVATYLHESHPNRVVTTVQVSAETQERTIDTVLVIIGHGRNERISIINGLSKCWPRIRKWELPPEELQRGFNNVGNATRVYLPAASAGDSVIIRNVGEQELQVMPPENGTINALDRGRALTVRPGTTTLFTQADRSAWYSLPMIPDAGDARTSARWREASERALSDEAANRENDV